MATYTMELREMLDQGLTLFDFDYDLYQNAYKPILEEKIKRHFYFWEIGQETPARFKHMFQTVFKEELPLFNAYYKALDREFDFINSKNVIEDILNSKTEGSSSASSNTTLNNLFSDTPQSRVNLNNPEHITNITNNTGTDATAGESDTETTTTNNRTEQGLWRMSEIELLGIYKEKMFDVDKLFINALEKCFLQVF